MNMKLPITGSAKFRRLWLSLKRNDYFAHQNIHATIRLNLTDLRVRCLDTGARDNLGESNTPPTSDAHSQLGLVDGYIRVLPDEFVPAHIKG